MAAHGAGLPLRRHSVDIAGVSSMTVYDPVDDMTASASPSSADGSSASPDPSADLTTQRFLFPGPADGM